jgi:hypothetical protein
MLKLRFLGYDAVCFGRYIPVFWRKLLATASEYKVLEDASSRFLRKLDVSLSCYKISFPRINYLVAN